MCYSKNAMDVKWREFVQVLDGNYLDNEYLFLGNWEGRKNGGIHFKGRGKVRLEFGVLLCITSN